MLDIKPRKVKMIYKTTNKPSYNFRTQEVITALYYNKVIINEVFFFHCTGTFPNLTSIKIIALKRSPA